MASITTMDGRSAGGGGLEDQRQDDELRTLNGNSYQDERYSTSPALARHTVKTSERGILRGTGATLHASEHDGPIHNVAFLDPAPDATYFRSRRHSPTRNGSSHMLAFEDNPTGSSHPSFQPLSFEKRRTYSSGRSSFSCSACTDNLPVSPLSDGTGRSSCPRTPSLCRSETEASEANSAASAAASQHQCPHTQTPQHVSLLTAALLAGEVSPKRSPQYACGILKRQAQASAVFEGDSDSGQGPIGDKPTGHTRFVEPPKPTRLGPRRISLPPNRCGPRLSASPDHYSEGPESPPRPLIFDAQAHAAFAPPGPPNVPTQEAAKPPQVSEKKRVLTFQDPVGFEDRAKARENLATRPALAGKADTSMHASTSRPPSPAPPQARAPHTTNEQEAHLHGLARSPHPSCISQDFPSNNIAGPSPPPRESSKNPASRKLQFAASPSELKLKRASAARTPRQQGDGRHSAATSEDEGPYVDSVAARGASQQGRGRPPASTSPILRPRGSPAPKRPSALESRGSSGQRRRGSPAPKAHIPPSQNSESLDTASTFDDDDLDYDEDDEDEYSSDDDDTDSLEGDSQDEKLTNDGSDSESSEERNEHCHISHDTSSTSPLPCSPAKQSPQPSISSRTHPAAFSSSDWEEETEGLARTGDDTGSDAFEAYFSIGGARRPSRTAGSPLPFARGRLPSTAVSDAEMSLSRQPSPAVTTPGYRPTRPSISPVRSRSAAVAVPSTSAAGRAQSKSSSRSFSSASRCAPSLLASAEQAQAQPNSPPLDPQSLDAWSKLRSCLENAIGGSDGPSDARRPWFSAMSTPGGRTLSISPHEVTDHRPMTLASAALSSSALDRGACHTDHQALDEYPGLYRHGALGLDPPAQIDSDLDWSLDRPNHAAGQRSRRPSGAEAGHKQKPIRIMAEASSAAREDTLLAGVNRLKTVKRKPFKSCSPAHERSHHNAGEEAPRGEAPVRPRSAARLRSRRPSEMQFGWGRPEEAANFQ